MIGVFVFDGSMEGLLTAVFDWYELKPGPVRLVSSHRFEPSFLMEAHEVITDETKAKRVWEGLRKKLDPAGLQRFRYAFLSEDEEAFRQLFDFARYVFDQPKGAEANFAHPAVLAVQQWAKKVARERHRMTAFVRFRETADGIFYAPVEPDFNVLPLIATFFKNRFADQQWVIYDVKRKYGLFYDLEKVAAVTLDFEARPEESQEEQLSEKEALFGLLWKDYFRSTNIPARKNMKLHLRHVPKRYWKYLTEKS